MTDLNYTVVDNFLPDVEFKLIKDNLLGMDISWYYSPYVASPDMPDDGFYFVHNFYYDFKPNSNYFGLVIPLIKKVQANSLIRMKANLYPNVGRRVENNYHADQDYPHKGMVYYVNTNNGYTELEDGTIIESVENRALLFDSSRIHRSVSCTDEKCRVTINLNYF